jgi:hypothetical protein
MFSTSASNDAGGKLDEDGFDGEVHKEGLVNYTQVSDSESEGKVEAKKLPVIGTTLEALSKTPEDFFASLTAPKKSKKKSKKGRVGVEQVLEPPSLKDEEM